MEILHQSSWIHVNQKSKADRNWLQSWGVKMMQKMIKAGKAKMQKLAKLGWHDDAIDYLHSEKNAGSNFGCGGLLKLVYSGNHHQHRFGHILFFGTFWLFGIFWLFGWWGERVRFGEETVQQYSGQLDLGDGKSFKYNANFSTKMQWFAVNSESPH